MVSGRRARDPLFKGTKHAKSIIHELFSKGNPTEISQYSWLKKVFLWTCHNFQCHGVRDRSMCSLLYGERFVRDSL